MKELFSHSRLPVAVLALAVGAAACGSSNTAAKSNHHARKPVATTQHMPNIQVRYFANGTRELDMSDINNSNVLSNGGFGGTKTGFVRSMFQFCDGMNMVSVAETDQDDLGGSISVIANSPACQDGRLTPKDFPRTPDETVTQP